MTQAAQIATEYARLQSDKQITDRIAAIEDSGTQIITLSDEVRNEIRKKSQTVYDSVEENISEDIYNAYLGSQ